jgi:hypothetical protein
MKKYLLLLFITFSCQKEDDFRSEYCYDCILYTYEAIIDTNPALIGVPNAPLGRRLIKDEQLPPKCITEVEYVKWREEIYRSQFNIKRVGEKFTQVTCRKLSNK